MDNFYKLVLLFSLTFFSFESFALVKPVGFRNTTKTVNGLSTAVRFSNSSGSIYTKVVNIGKQSLGQALKRRLFSPWGLALTAALVAANYIIDDQAQEIQELGIIDNSPGSCSGQTGLTIAQCLTAFNENIYISTTVRPFRVGKWPDAAHQYTFYSIQQPTYHTGYYDFDDGLDHGSDPSGGTSVLTDEAIADIATDTLTSSQLSSVLTDPLTLSPDLQIQEVQQAATDLATEDALLNDADPSNDPAVQTAVNTAAEVALQEQLQTNLDADAQVQSQTQQQTDFCLSNPNASACAPIGPALTAVPITTNVVPFSYNPISLSGSAVCPAPPVINASFGTMTLSNAPLCNFASSISGLIIAACTIVGLYILNGSRQNG